PRVAGRRRRGWRPGRPVNLRGDARAHAGRLLGDAALAARGRPPRGAGRTRGAPPRGALSEERPSQRAGPRKPPDRRPRPATPRAERPRRAGCVGGRGSRVGPRPGAPPSARPLQKSRPARGSRRRRSGPRTPFPGPRGVGVDISRPGGVLFLLPLERAARTLTGE